MQIVRLILGRGKMRLPEIISAMGVEEVPEKGPREARECIKLSDRPVALINPAVNRSLTDIQTGSRPIIDITHCAYNSKTTPSTFRRDVAETESTHTRKVADAMLLKANTLR